MSMISDIRIFRGVYTVSTDDGQSLRVRAADYKKNPVRIGENVDFDAFTDRIAAAQFPSAYEAALSMLDLSAKTKTQLRRALIQKGYVQVCVEAALARLEEMHLVDDAALAARLAENAAGKPVGRYALKRKLRAKGISEEDAEDALGGLDEEQQAEAAKAAAKKLVRKYVSLPNREARAKLSQALARRGFPWDAVHAAVECAFEEDDDDAWD